MGHRRHEAGWMNSVQLGCTREVRTDARSARGAARREMEGKGEREESAGLNVAETRHIMETRPSPLEVTRMDRPGPRLVHLPIASTETAKSALWVGKWRGSVQSAYVRGGVPRYMCLFLSRSQAGEAGRPRRPFIQLDTSRLVIHALTLHTAYCYDSYVLRVQLDIQDPCTASSASMSPFTVTRPSCWA